MKKSLAEFVDYMKERRLAPNSIKAYVKAVEMFDSIYGDWTSDNLEAFKQYLVCRNKPQTVNQRILALNKYLLFVGETERKLTPVKIQNKSFSENIISCEEYLRLKNGLLADKDKKWYYMVWTMGVTGARVSELMQIRIEDIVAGHVDIVSKGGKSRRIYFPQSLRSEIEEWGMSEGLCSGPLFLNNRGEPITTRGFAMHLKRIARKYGVNESVVYPHSFRHMYAKNFLEKFNDISTLADLLGHESIETTQIYLRRSSREQMRMIDDIVTW